MPDSSATDTKLHDYYNSHKDRYAGTGSFTELRSEIKADYLNDTRTAEITKLLAQLEKSADIKK